MNFRRKQVLVNPKNQPRTGTHLVSIVCDGVCACVCVCMSLVIVILIIITTSIDPPHSLHTHLLAILFSRAIFIMQFGTTVYSCYNHLDL